MCATLLQVYATWCCWWLQGDEPQLARPRGHLLLFLCVLYQVLLWRVTGHINPEPWVSCTHAQSHHHTHVYSPSQIQNLRSYPLSSPLLFLKSTVALMWDLDILGHYSVVTVVYIEVMTGLPSNLTLIFNQITPNQRVKHRTSDRQGWLGFRSQTAHCICSDQSCEWLNLLLPWSFYEFIFFPSVWLVLQGTSQTVAHSQRR